jgi:hypothetical protein
MDNLTPKMLEAISKLSEFSYKYHEEINIKLVVLQALKKRGLVESMCFHGVYPETYKKIKWRLLPMKNKTEWIKKHREFVGKKVFLIDFNKFLKDKKLTVEELSKIISYTFDGTMKMLERGTIKLSTYNKLKELHSDLDKYKKDVR